VKRVKGLEALQVAVLMAIVALAATAVFSMMRDVRPPEAGGAVLDVEAVANATIYSKVKDLFSRNVVLSNVTGSVVTYVGKANVVELPSNGSLVVVGRVLVGRGLIHGVRIIDMRTGTVQAITLLDRPAEVKEGDVVMINVSLPAFSKFYKVEFVGKGLRTVDAWSTQIR